MATVGDEVVDAVVVEAVEEAVVVAERLTTVAVPATMAGVAEVATGVVAHLGLHVAHARVHPQDAVSDHLLVVGLLRETSDLLVPGPLGPALLLLLDDALPLQRPPVGDIGLHLVHAITVEVLLRVVIAVRLLALLLHPVKAAQGDGDAHRPLFADEVCHLVGTEGGSAVCRNHAREVLRVTVSVEGRRCTRVAGNGTETEGSAALTVGRARSREGIEAEAAVAAVNVGRTSQALPHLGVVSLN